MVILLYQGRSKSERSVEVLCRAIIGYDCRTSCGVACQQVAVESQRSVFPHGAPATQLIARSGDIGRPNTGRPMQIDGKLGWSCEPSLVVVSLIDILRCHLTKKGRKYLRSAADAGKQAEYLGLRSQYCSKFKMACTISGPKFHGTPRFV